MLVALVQNTNQRQPAYNALRGAATWVCPACKWAVTLKQGAKVTPHFAHTPGADCVYGVGESEEHRACKMEIYNALRQDPGVSKVELEWPLGTVRPDIIAIINGNAVAIEVQVSNLSLDLIAYRTEEYAKKKVAVLWFHPTYPALLPKNEDARFSPTIWGRWLHATYFGRMYFWTPGSGLWLTPVHLAPAYIFSPYKEWPESRGSGDSEADDGGGGSSWNHQDAYWRRSKRWRTSLVGPPVSITKDFVVKRRTAWAGGDLVVPAALLYQDGCPPWWGDRDTDAPSWTCRHCGGLIDSPDDGEGVRCSQCARSQTDYPHCAGCGKLLSSKTRTYCARCAR